MSVRSLGRAAALAAALLVPRASSAVASTAPRIELITMAEGDELYESFGHAALRVVDPARSTDQVYNFGAFRDQPGLVLSFLRGGVPFYLARSTWQRTLRAYRARDRTIVRHVLALDDAVARGVAEALRRNHLPENRHYRYHHFYDNCATRVRDLIDSAAGGALSRATGTAPGSATFRDRVRVGFGADLRLLLLSELLVGRPVDRVATRWEEAFLPLRLADEVQAIPGLVGATHTVYERKSPLPQPDPLGGVRLLGWLALVPLLCLGLALARRRRPPTRSAVSATGLGLILWGLAGGGAGVLVLVTAALSNLPELRINENLLVVPALDVWLVAPGVAWLTGRVWAAAPVRAWLWFRLAALAMVLAGRALGVGFGQGTWAVPALATLSVLALLWAAARVGQFTESGLLPSPYIGSGSAVRGSTLQSASNPLSAR